MTQGPRDHSSRSKAAVGALAVAVLGIALVSVDASAGAQPSGHTAKLPDQVTTRSGVQQMITVSSARWDTTRATLRAWRRPANGEWKLAAGPFPARIGWNGWVPAPERQQSTGTTPAGNFQLVRAFGALADPGTSLPYRRFDNDDRWPYEPRDPATYNVYQRWKAKATKWRPGYVERLSDYPVEYAYAVVIGFNLPSGVHYSARRGQWVARDQADTARGGGIFLHVREQDTTAGCVSVGLRALRELVRWINPQRNPRIVMGPRSYVVTL